MKVVAVLQEGPTRYSKPRKLSEPPWYDGKFRVLAARLAGWLASPEEERHAYQVVHLLWTHPGNVNSLRASEAAQCVAFRAAATWLVYGELPESEVGSS